MSDYELLDVFYAALNGLQGALMNNIAVLFAFLIAGYLVATKLESRIVFIIVGLFTLVTLQQAIATFGLGHDFAGAAAQIVARAADDPSALG